MYPYFLFNINFSGNIDRIQFKEIHYHFQYIFHNLNSCYYKLHLILVMDSNLKQISGACKSNTVYISRKIDLKKEIWYLPPFKNCTTYRKVTALNDLNLKEI